jgi:outer membrane protein
MQAAASIGLMLMSLNVQPAIAQQTNPTAPATPQTSQTVQNDTTGQAG